MFFEYPDSAFARHMRGHRGLAGMSVIDAEGAQLWTPLTINPGTDDRLSESCMGGLVTLERPLYLTRLDDHKSSHPF
jgi:hypothetical protein